MVNGESGEEKTPVRTCLTGVDLTAGVERRPVPLPVDTPDDLAQTATRIERAVGVGVGAGHAPVVAHTVRKPSAPLPDASIELGDLVGTRGARVVLRTAPLGRLGGDLVELVLGHAEVTKERKAPEPRELLDSTDRVVRANSSTST